MLRYFSPIYSLRQPFHSSHPLCFDTLYSGGSRIFPGGGRRDTILLNFPENSMKSRKIRSLGGGGGAGGAPPPDPPLLYTTITHFTSEWLVQRQLHPLRRRLYPPDPSSFAPSFSLAVAVKWTQDVKVGLYLSVPP